MIRDNIWAKLMIWGAKMGCHQRPDRSFFINGKYQFPVCARCTGVILGYVAAICTVGISIPVALCLAFCGVMFLDWLIQFLGIHSSTNVRRLITGIMGGFGLLRLELMALFYIIALCKSIMIEAQYACMGPFSLPIEIFDIAPLVVA